MIPIITLSFDEWFKLSLKERERHNRKLRRDRLANARERGTHTENEWTSMLSAYGWSCVKCGSLDSKDNPIHKDHIIPIYQDGSDSIKNIQPLCRNCNCGKCGWNTEDWRIGNPATRPEWLP